ncbi:hypothetical protein Syun_001308 [Stephania yunnanensis]|uniref:Uncharacterized protein n=1 Tax=Stephania yunnanensis TaxID=152371 RepID=A0AAP0LDL8_9MAGN
MPTSGDAGQLHRKWFGRSPARQSGPAGQCAAAAADQHDAEKLTSSGAAPGRTTQLTLIQVQIDVDEEIE